LRKILIVDVKSKKNLASNYSYFFCFVLPSFVITFKAENRYIWDAAVAKQEEVIPTQIHHQRVAGAMALATLRAAISLRFLIG